MIRFATVGLIFCFVSNVSSLSTQRATVDAAVQIGMQSASSDVHIGEVSKIIGDPDDPTTFYAATNGRGIFKSADGGDTWKKIGGGKTVVINPPDPNIVYMEDDTAIFKSANGGTSWVPVTLGLGEGPFYGLAINPSDPSTLYVGSGHKIFQTTNGGQSWRAMASALEDGQFSLLVDPKNPQVIYALSEGLSKSTDAGANWTYIDSELPKGEVNTISLVPSDSSVLYVGTEKHGIYKSTNGGESWSRLTSGLITKNLNEAQAEIPRVRAIAIDPSEPKTLYAGVSANLTGGLTAAIFKSTNSGETWKLLRIIGSGNGSTNVNCLTVDPFAPNVIFAGADGDGIFKSVDGGLNWSAEDSALSTGNIVTLSIGQSDGTVYAGTMEGLYKLDGQRWRQVGFRHRDFGGEWVASLAVDPSDSATVYVGTRSSDVSNQGGLFQSTNGGRSWSAVDSGLRHFAGWISALAIDPSHRSNLYAGTAGYGIFKTTNAGMTWTPSNSGIGRGELSIVALAIDPKNSATVYALTPGFVWKSTNQGAHWSPGKGIPPPLDSPWSPRLTTIAINPVNPSVMYVAQFSLRQAVATLYESTDAGGDWIPIGKANETPLSYLSVDPRDPVKLYAANSDSGILKSVDSGRSWAAMNSGLPTKMKPPLGFVSKTLVTGLVVDPIHPSAVYISTHGRGVFKSADGGSNWSPVPTN